MASENFINMKELWKETIGMVTQKADQLLKDRQIKDGVVGIDYAAIFPRSKDEYNLLMERLQQEGKPVKVVPTGTVFRTKESAKTPQGEVSLVRVRIYNPDKSQRGYVDYQVDDYERFKKRYLASGAVSVVHNQDGVEMLTAENEEVIVYFPEIPLGKTLENEKRG